ncbi:MAG: glycoside hydrolase family 1 protein [Planctomycetota bacterium]
MPDRSGSTGGLPFPAGFYWGCATSPAQIEGATASEYAGFRARDGATPDDGPDHWTRWEDDLQALGDLGLNAYRIGLDWGRLQPAPGAALAAEPLAQYREMLARLRARRVEPFVTLFHFACPAWMAEAGGWLHRDAPAWFADFARRTADACDGVRYWITHNEPVVYALMAYIIGEFLPCRRHRPDLALRALRHLRRGHAQAYAAIRARRAEARVGFTKHFKGFQPFRRWHPVDVTTSWLARLLFDRWGTAGFLHHRGRQVCDFVGVNYYGRMRMKGLSGVSPLTGWSPETLARMGAVCDDMWEQDPRWLADCLAELAERTELPLYITENGVATLNEDLRTHYLREHLRGCADAIGRGVALHGFFYWSLLDNFEWSEGLSKRFGLLGVDFGHPDKPRTLRPAAHLLADAARRNALPPAGD